LQFTEGAGVGGDAFGLVGFGEEQGTTRGENCHQSYCERLQMTSPSGIHRNGIGSMTSHP